MIHTFKPEIWDNLKLVWSGLGMVNYDKFKKIVKTTIHVGDDYAANAWIDFCHNRLAYCLSRRPPEQGYAIINLAYQLITSMNGGER